MKLWIILIKFIFIGALFIVSNQNLYLNNTEDLKTFSELYLSWFGQLYTHIGRITGYVIDSEWLPGGGNITTTNTLGIEG